MRVFNSFPGSFSGRPDVRDLRGRRTCGYGNDTAYTVVYLRRNPAFGSHLLRQAEFCKKSLCTGWHCSRASFKIATSYPAPGISGTGYAVRDVTATFRHGKGGKIRFYRKKAADDFSISPLRP
jgi:hypothetical protein